MREPDCTYSYRDSHSCGTSTIEWDGIGPHIHSGPAEHLPAKIQMLNEVHPDTY